MKTGPSLEWNDIRHDMRHGIRHGMQRAIRNDMLRAFHLKYKSTWYAERHKYAYSVMVCIELSRNALRFDSVADYTPSLPAQTHVTSTNCT